MNLITIKCY